MVLDSLKGVAVLKFERLMWQSTISMGKNFLVETSLLDRVPIAQMVERPLREREVVGSIPGRAIPKALKMVPVATLLGAQHYKASTGSSLTHY